MELRLLQKQVRTVTDWAKSGLKCIADHISALTADWYHVIVSFEAWFRLGFRELGTPDDIDIFEGVTSFMLYLPMTFLR